MVVALAVAAAARGEGSDGPLQGVFGGIVVPLLAYALASVALGGASLKAAISPWTRLGATRFDSLTAVFVAAGGASALAAGLLGGVVVVLTRTTTSPSSDAFTTAWIAALGALAYAATFLAASSFGKRGGGRGFLLAYDFLLGASNGTAGTWTVRGHLRNLLGGTPPNEVSQRNSTVMLVVFVVLAVAIAMLRTAPQAARVRAARS